MNAAMQDRVTARTALLNSGVSSIAIAVLIAWTFAYVFRASDATVRLIVLQSSLFGAHPGIISVVGEITAFWLKALSGFAGAWLLSWWVHRGGPLHALVQWRLKPQRRPDV